MIDGVAYPRAAALGYMPQPSEVDSPAGSIIAASCLGNDMLDQHPRHRGIINREGVGCL
jgi:hypothetical protein